MKRIDITITTKTMSAQNELHEISIVKQSDFDLGWYLQTEYSRFRDENIEEMTVNANGGKQSFSALLKKCRHGRKTIFDNLYVEGVLYEKSSIKDGLRFWADKFLNQVSDEENALNKEYKIEFSNGDVYGLIYAENDKEVIEASKYYFNRGAARIYNGERFVAEVPPPPRCKCILHTTWNSSDNLPL